MEESRKTIRKDLYYNRNFSAIYFVLNLAAMITDLCQCYGCCYRGVTGIVTGIPFLLMTAKVRKPGAVLIMGTITALLYFCDWSVYSIVTDYICHCMYIVRTVQSCDKI